MRYAFAMRIAALAVLIALALAACSHPKPPAGRWEGTYESADTMLAARLEIEDDGQVRVSAPDLLDVGPDERDAARGKLAADLASDWDRVAPRKMDFDGETFRKPGGIAPQIVWKAKSKQMWLVVYLGTRPGLRIAMREVGDFSDDPWSR
jgi:hypothetical protein